MRIHKPSQRTTDDRWDYTISSDEEGWIHAAGYCGAYFEPVDTDLIHWREEERQKVIANKHKFHTDGHATPEEAQKCYNEYIVDQRLTFYRVKNEDAVALYHCRFCNAFTGNVADTNEFRSYYLCDEHLTPEIVRGFLDLNI